MNDYRALDPRRSIVVEACAGSGKTWLLVSRIFRLLLDGAQPSQILAITFTRKTAQEMQARLQEWLRDLAQGDDDFVLRFLAERGIASADAELLQRARALYENTMLAQPGITISTFHGWFMQVLQRAPLNSGVMQGMTLLERAGSEIDAAWETLLEQMRASPDSHHAQEMLWLFGEYGLSNTKTMLMNFLARRSEWWAYTWEQPNAVTYALQQLQRELGVDMETAPAADWGQHDDNAAAVMAFIRQLAANGTLVQRTQAGNIEQAWTDTPPEQRYAKLFPLLFTQGNEPRRNLKPSKAQSSEAEAFLAALDALQSSLKNVFDRLADQKTLRLNQAIFHCGNTLLSRYQGLKQQKQQMDFTDLEWQLCQLLQRSEHAETMQYKLDSRYRHVLLDEFQDTNPLQWQIMRAWFDAAAAVESGLTVFMVGDPKQSIYRFRRADARLFDRARRYLAEDFGAEEIRRNETRRSAQPVVDAVNAVFASYIKQPDGFAFEPHSTHQHDLPGCVLALPLAQADQGETPAPESGALALRDPLTEARGEKAEGARHAEAAQFAVLLQDITQTWSVRDAHGDERRAAWSDIMVLVRNRTHLSIYEAALRKCHIPFISSRHGGLLDTLEAQDIQSLLTFLIAPFDDLSLARILRSPVFSCSDDDLLRLAQARTEQESAAWWQRLQRMEQPSPALQRARHLLQGWLARADKLPVHDLLDRIYFESDLLARYTAALPPETRARATANLLALLEIALAVDAGRYPSLPHFLQELRELRDSDDDAPDEGRLGSAGNAIRIYTVHAAKGLEAPIVWLLDTNTGKSARDSHDVLLDWPPDASAPAHFSIYADLASRKGRRMERFDQEAEQQAREEMNLLYVAMTRAKQ
ncbi:MAG: UvrD-helicase domain-containing protein, partial [Gallionellaceae bacterium]|nr:UvrD-helicase domain-containing protein [Gallionellaceae bacterium]